MGKKIRPENEVPTICKCPSCGLSFLTEKDFDEHRVGRVGSTHCEAPGSIRMTVRHAVVENDTIIDVWAK